MGRFSNDKNEKVNDAILKTETFRYKMIFFRMPMVYNMLQKMPYSKHHKQAIEALQRAEQIRILSQISSQFAEVLEKINSKKKQVDAFRQFRIAK